MKPVYIDITNIPKLKRYTGISRVASEVASKMIRDGIDVRLLSYDPHDHAYRLIDNDCFILLLNGILTDNSKCYTDTLIPVDELEEGSVFFEINSAWHTLPNRSWLLPRLKNRRIRIVCVIQDLIPIRNPQYMVGQTLLRFMEFLTAHMTYADDILVTTDDVKADVEQLFRELELPVKPITKIGLGADFSADKGRNDASETVDMAVESMLEGRRFLLTVGTVEPRKNHKILIDAYERALSDMDIDVVIVGRIGWQMEGLLNRIKSNRKYGKGLYVLSDVNDATLKFLYSKAFMVVFPSYTEGYGLPTIESLINGVPVACSDIGVMREVGGDFADYFHPDKPDELIAAVKRFADDPALYAAQRKRIAREYQPPRWSDTVDAYERLIFSEDITKRYAHEPVKQVVFLSARPAPILATLPYIEEFMPFITELVVCCPDSMAEFMKENYQGRLKLTTVTDDQLLAGRALPPDHSTRNFFLRCLAMEQECIDNEFIMCDDDYRPLKPLTEETFYRDGKYRGYYFSDISTWKYRITEMFSYDYCHLRTLEFLKAHGYPTLQYSSHQPQLINKRWYLEMIRTYPDIITKGYDEWSTYFNYISAEHREQYTPCPYVTLSWPPVGGPTKGVDQPEFVFENFYEDNYQRGGYFAGCSQAFTSREKVLRDNDAKIVTAIGCKARFAEAKRNSDRIAAEYEAKYHEKPCISAYFYGPGSTKPDLGVPCVMKLSRSMPNFVSLSVARAPWTEANASHVCYELSVFDAAQKVYYGRNIEFAATLDYTEAAILLPADTPAGGLSFRVTVRLKSRLVIAERVVPVMIID